LASATKTEEKSGNLNVRPCDEVVRLGRNEDHGFDFLVGFDVLGPELFSFAHDLTYELII
jgi:hypothetical protein